MEEILQRYGLTFTQALMLVIMFRKENTGDILGVKREDSFIVGIAPEYILKIKNGVSFMFLDKDIMDTILNRQ